jgi:NAD(P)-dependent dehydrogenase (short-subunit alcohol dehydrogenase family)
VTANSIAPYVIETPMIHGIPGIEELKSRIPVGRAGIPRDVAVAVRYLCSPEAGYITGETLRLTGGFLP